MKKVKKIFLDNYTKSNKQDADLMITLAKTNEDDIPATLYFKRKDLPWMIKFIDDSVVWSDDTRIAVNVDQDTYNNLVDWWFDNISEEFKESLMNLSDDAIKYGFDISMSVNKARNKLKIMDKQSRKSNLSKFLIDWVSIGCNRYINKIRKTSIYS